MTQEKLNISDRFDIDDIRKIRDYNAERYLNMTTAEIIAEVNGNAEEIIKRYGLKPIAII
ncbi:MAG: hypothetical protein J6O04_01835 [Selenomonadaceae bacterium]|nr:hypothetical protein [Selenomonadaceae bacterium]